MVVTGVRSKTFLAAALLACTVALVVPVSAMATKTLGLSSGTFKFTVSAGDTVGGDVSVVNDGTEPLKVLVYAADQRVDSKGAISYTAPSRADLASQQDPSTWTRVSMPADSKSLGNIPYLELAPGKRVPVKFSFAVPSSVPPGDHNVVIFFESFEMSPSGEGAQSMVSGRLGARVTLRVKGDIVENLQVKPFNVPAFVIGSEIPYRFTVRNTGNVDQRVVARAVLLDRGDNELVVQIPIKARLVFAGNQLEATGTIVADKQQLWGPHVVSVDVTPVDDDNKPLDFAKNTVTNAQRVWLVPLWFVVALGLFLVLLAGRIIWSLAVNAAARKVGTAPAGSPEPPPVHGGGAHAPARAPRAPRDAEAQARREARERRRLEAEAEEHEHSLANGGHAQAPHDELGESLPNGADE